MNADLPFRLKPFGFPGEGAQIEEWSTILELIYEGRGGMAPDDPINSWP